MDDSEPILSAAQIQSAFEQLHPGVQRQLWKMGWTHLRPLQVDAIHCIMGSDVSVVLAASTAAGKTEAAFLPILSKIADEPSGSIRAVYIGPLKALINDQFARIEELCSHLEVPVFRWHGDVGATHQETLVKTPGGVLLITPESLESLFVNRSQFLGKLFSGLQFAVIDELHSFLGNERGLHLRSLLSRLSQFPTRPYRSVGLSATIGDSSVAQRYLDIDQPDAVRLIHGKSGQKELKFRIHGYRSKPDADVVGDHDYEPSDSMYRAAQDIARHCAGTANLVFANARRDVEEYADLCQRIAHEKQPSATFLVHHGSLSAEIREGTEQTMKEGSATTTICSSTLEMGIDIGSVKMVGQIGAPWSVSSMKQRIGRSGRKDGDAQIMRVYIQCHQGGPDSDLLDRLNLELLQAIVVTELMLEGWVEPQEPPLFDLSTLTQQVISVIAQTGGIRADRVYEQLCIHGPFREIEKSIFAKLLLQLATADVLEQMEGGDLILGLKGEHLRKNKGFYAVFPTPDDYTILFEGVVLGKLQSTYEKRDHLLFAGRRWQVVDVDNERLIVHVQPAHGWRRPKFGGGIGDVHPRVREKMREVLLTPPPMTYLDIEARLLFEEAMKTARASEILESDIVALGPRRSAVMTWTGTRVQETAIAWLAAIGVEAHDEGVAIRIDLSVDETRRALKETLSKEPALEAIADNFSNRTRRKYDELIGDPLCKLSLARGRLAVALCRKIFQCA